MKILGYFSILMLVSLSIFGQQTWHKPSFVIHGYATWPYKDPRGMYVDTLTNSLYIGGNFAFVDSQACYGSMIYDSLGARPIDTTYRNQFMPLCFVRYKSDMYMGVYGGLFKLNNNRWDTVLYNSSDWVFDLYVKDDTLLIGGDFYGAGGIPYNGLAQFDGTNFSDFKGFEDSIIQSNAISSINEFNGNIVLGGGFGSDRFQYMAMWNGNDWNNFDGGLGNNNNGWIKKTIVYKGELYAGGDFNDEKHREISGIAKWNGGNWERVGGGLNYWSRIEDMIVFNDQLWIAGSIDSVGFLEAHNIAMWNGVQWAVPDSGFDRSPTSMAVFNDSLWVGGWFEEVGVSFDSLDSTISKPALVIYDTTSRLIYDSLYLYYGISEINEEDDINIYPNPTTGKLTIETSGKGEVFIYNSLGSLILRQAIINEGKTEIDILLSSPRGIYYLKFTTGQSTLTKKIIIR